MQSESDMAHSDKLASSQIDQLLVDCSTAYRTKREAEYNRRKIFGAVVDMLFSSIKTEEVIKRISAITEIKIETVEKIISEAIDHSRAERP